MKWITVKDADTQAAWKAALTLCTSFSIPVVLTDQEADFSRISTGLQMEMGEDGVLAALQILQKVSGGKTFTPVIDARKAQLAGMS